MSERVFVDTNVLLRYLLGDVPEQLPAAKRFMATIAKGDLVAVLSDTVLFETIYVMEKQQRIPRSVICDTLLAIITMATVDLPDKRMYVAVFQRYIERPALSFADCYHIELAKKLAGGRLVTFDKKAGKSVGVDWIEPV